MILHFEAAVCSGLKGAKVTDADIKGKAKHAAQPREWQLALYIIRWRALGPFNWGHPLQQHGSGG